MCPEQHTLKYVCVFCRERGSVLGAHTHDMVVKSDFCGDAVVLRLCVHAVCECQWRAALLRTRRQAAASSIQTSSLGKTNLGSEMT